MENGIIRHEEVELQPLNAVALRRQVNALQEAMQEVMILDTHYGVVPGCKKPSLYKPGAEKICLMFRMVPEFKVERRDYENGHREYEVFCTLKFPNGQLAGSGVGSCSTLESKYRYRKGDDFEVLDEPIPQDYRENKGKYRSQGLGAKKVNNQWCWVRYAEGRVENPDLADCYNTVLKMAKKRAHIDATITATAAGDIFTQDIEDLPEFAQEVKVEPVEQGREEQAERVYIYRFNELETPEERQAMKNIAKKKGAKPNYKIKAWVSAVPIPELDAFLTTETSE